jgi:hypothetical protein
VNLLLAQFWQGGPGGPAVALVVKANDGFACSILIRNNQTGANPGSTKVIDVPLGTCAPDGNWHTALFHVRGGYQNNGQVQVWWDKDPGPNPTQTVTAHYEGNVGYVPGQCVHVNGTGPCQTKSDGTIPVANSSLVALYGPYRPNDSVKEQLFLANIKFANNIGCADPRTP